MILMYIFFGILLAAIGGAPLGASNVAVVTTSTKESISKGMRIAYGAGFGEVMLAFFALSYSNLISEFFTMNPWIQIVFISLFFFAGIYFISPKKPKLKLKKPVKSPSKLISGFFLALINPPVLIYWVLAISLTQKYFLSLSDMSPISILTLFFLGVFLGKVGILFLYGKWSTKFQKEKKESPSKLFKIIGFALILISLAQGIRFAVS